MYFFIQNSHAPVVFYDQDLYLGDNSQTLQIVQHIPSDFWHSYMDKPSESARLEYSNKCWPVKLKYGSSKLHFERGWFQFVRENSLQVGNVCRFELIQRDDYAFKVSVRRGASEFVYC